MDSQTALLLERLRQFAVRIVRFVRVLPSRPECMTLAQQLVRAGTGVIGNYRAACRARSTKEFTARLGVAVEEADESVLWLDVILDSGTQTNQEAHALLGEAREIRAILARSAKTARGRLAKSTGQQVNKSTDE